MPVSRRLQVYNSVIHYECKNCSAGVDITPAASIGVLTMVGILAFSFWGWIIFRRDGVPDILALSLFATAVIAFFVIALSPLIKHFQNPVVTTAAKTDLPVAAGDRHIAKGPILWVENLGYFAGLLVPVIVVLGVLGAATLIGYVNFTYF